MPEYLLEVRNIGRSVGDRTLLSGISFHLQPGEVLFVRGPKWRGQKPAASSASLLGPLAGSLQSCWHLGVWTEELASSADLPFECRRDLCCSRARHQSRPATRTGGPRQAELLFGRLHSCTAMRS